MACSCTRASKLSAIRRVASSAAAPAFCRGVAVALATACPQRGAGDRDCHRRSGGRHDGNESRRRIEPGNRFGKIVGIGLNPDDHGLHPRRLIGKGGNKRVDIEAPQRGARRDNHRYAARTHAAFDHVRRGQACHQASIRKRSGDGRQRLACLAQNEDRVTRRRVSGAVLVVG
ncbi:hypothetical protein IP88_08095 [alpha proteobacterium AAP81b]|nr:hypothetical protein IP88_08095 [alpha proteobacterium AAP81b]